MVLNSASRLVLTSDPGIAGPRRSQGARPSRSQCSLGWGQAGTVLFADPHAGAWFSLGCEAQSKLFWNLLPSQLCAAPVGPSGSPHRPEGVVQLRPRCSSCRPPAPGREVSIPWVALGCPESSTVSPSAGVGGEGGLLSLAGTSGGAGPRGVSCVHIPKSCDPVCLHGRGVSADTLGTWNSSWRKALLATAWLKPGRAREQTPWRLGGGPPC